MCFLSVVYEPPTEGLPRFARVSDVSEALGVPARTVLDWIANGKLPAFKINRTVRVPHSALASIATAAAAQAATIDHDNATDEGDHN